MIISVTFAQNYLEESTEARELLSRGYKGHVNGVMQSMYLGVLYKGSKKCYVRHAVR